MQKTRKIYNGIDELNREPDFVWRDPSSDRVLSFWFDESIVKSLDLDYQDNPIYELYYFRRVEKKRGPRYQYNTEEFGWTSLTGCWITSYANQVIQEIEQARIRWMATKALEEALK